jgi:hypothetical protein
LNFELIRISSRIFEDLSIVCIDIRPIYFRPKPPSVGHYLQLCLTTNSDDGDNLIFSLSIIYLHNTNSNSSPASGLMRKRSQDMCVCVFQRCKQLQVVSLPMFCMLMRQRHYNRISKLYVNHMNTASANRPRSGAILLRDRLPDEVDFYLNFPNVQYIRKWLLFRVKRK